MAFKPGWRETRSIAGGGFEQRVGAPGGMRGWDCSGSHLGISVNDNRVSEVSRAGLSAGWARQALLTALSVVGGGIRGWFYGI